MKYRVIQRSRGDGTTYIPQVRQFFIWWNFHCCVDPNCPPLKQTFASKDEAVAFLYGYIGKLQKSKTSDKVVLEFEDNTCTQ
jgi:hypothetical protein